MAQGVTDKLWALNEAEVTMLRGVAWVGDQSCHIDVDLSQADAVLTIGTASPIVVPVAVDPATRDQLASMPSGGTVFYVGKLLRNPN